MCCICLYGKKISYARNLFLFASSYKSRGKGRPNMPWEAQRRSRITVLVLDLDAMWGAIREIHSPAALPPG